MGLADQGLRDTLVRIAWLADVLRAAGLTVVEHANWQTRAVPGSWEPRYGVVHATAAPRDQADTVQVRVVRDGRQGLPGPIANACVDRAGRWHVLAAGRCNTTIVGTAGPYRGLGNTNALGVEACNDNRAEPWPGAQYRAYVRGWAAIAYHLDWEPARLRGHLEHCPGHKTDPTFDMDRFRADVAAALAGGDDVSKADVQDALDDPQPWMSPGVAAMAKTNGWGPAVATRALLEYLFAEVVLTGPNRQAALLAAVLNVDEQVAARLGAGELDPRAIADLLRPVLGDQAAAVGQALAGAV